MIYTVTFNPALDYVMNCDRVEFGLTNRSYSEEISIGGKGLNVSRVLHNLNIPNKALGFVAGFTGDFIEKELIELGIDSDFIKLNNGFTRINIKLKTNSETELNAKGPVISKDDINKLFSKLSQVRQGDFLVLAGSVPQDLGDTVYRDIMEFVSRNNVKIVVDASGSLLLKCLEFKPFLIKPNKQEIEDIFNSKLNSLDEIFCAAQELRSKGALNVLVSLGKDGAVLVDEYGKKHFCNAYQGKTINTVGAGDSMIAGFIAGVYKGYDYALRLGNAAGAATAFSNFLASKEQIEQLMNKSSD